MNNFSTIYSGAIGRKGDLTDEKAAELNQQQKDAEFKDSLKLAWLSHPTTQQLIKSLSATALEKTELAISLAANFHANKDHQQIITLLVEVNTINTLLKSYASS